MNTAPGRGLIRGFPGAWATAVLLACAGFLLTGCETLQGRPATAAPGAAEIASLAVRADKAYRDEDWQTAEAAYTRLTEIAPDDAEHWFRRANACSHLNRPGDAVRLYGEALRRNPDHAGAWHNLGMTQLQLAARSFAELGDHAGDDEATRRRAIHIIEGITDLLGGELDAPSPGAMELESLRIQE